MLFQGIYFIKNIGKRVGKKFQIVGFGYAGLLFRDDIYFIMDNIHQVLNRRVEFSRQYKFQSYKREEYENRDDD